MLKIHPGFKAIALLAGPAAIVAGYQSLFNYFSPPRPYDPEVITVMRNIYQKCSEPPKLQRTVRCGEYISHFDECTRHKSKCSLESSYRMLVKLDLAPPSLRLPLTEKIIVTDRAGK